MWKKILSPHFFLILITIFSILPVSSKIYFLEADYYLDKTRQKKIILGKGEVISSDKEIARVAISDPEIADAQILSEKQLFVRAKKIGISTLLVWEKENPTPSRFDLAIWPDIDYLKTQLQDLDKNIDIEFIPPAISSISGSGDSESGESSGSSSESTSSQPALSAGSSQSQGSSSNSSETISGKIILKGDVANAEIIARALQIAGAYVGDQGIRIISHPGGQVVDGLVGKYDISSNSDSQSQSQSQSQNSGLSLGSRSQISFTSNRFANLSRGVIATTQHGSVISFLTVKDPPQISVAIRFYEISRSLSRDLGFNTQFGGHTLQGGTFVGGNIVSKATGAFGSISRLTGFMGAQGQQGPEFSFGNFSSPGGTFLSQELGDGVTGALFYPKNGIGLLIQALQARGEIKSLAEPTLVITNGEPASFLAGGEVPILKSIFTNGGTSQDINYEPFGIRFSILPSITSTDMIHLELVPEIRDIDTDLSNFVAAPGSTNIRPPAFKTRRTQTQVDLETGQAFAISGLLRNDNTRSLRKVPGVGDVPILGSLFRSKSFRKGETELLIVVTPEIVKPRDSKKVAQLSIPEVPYHDFDQLAPLKPYIQLDDEKGPDFKRPLDGGKYNTPEKGTEENNESSINNSTDSKEEKISFQQKSDEKPKEEIKNETKENKNLEFSESKPLEKIESQANNPTEPNQIQEPAKARKDSNTKKIEEFKKRFFKKEADKEIQTEEEKAISEQQELRRKWQEEMANYSKAKEAMKIARETKF